MGINILDMFCGTGGFASGVCEGIGKKAKVLAGIDILPYAIKTFEANHPKSASICRDVRDLSPKEFVSLIDKNSVKINLIIGGPPCQGFTSIRPYRSTDGEDLRNYLYEDFFQYIEYFKPKAFLMENVVGLATHNGGRTLNSILKRAKKAGYTVDWRIVNAATFGVPQRRERLIAIGIRDGSKPDFPTATHGTIGSTIGYKDRSKMILPTQTLSDFSKELKTPLSSWDAISDLPPIGSGEEHEEYTNSPKNEFQKLMRRNEPSSLTLHYATNHSKAMLKIIKHSGYNRNHLPKGLTTSGFSTSYSRLEPDLPAPTITGNFPFPGSNKCIHPYQNRAITPREAARLQSFPDDYVFIGNKTQIAKLIGNAVPFLLGFALGKHLSKHFE